MPWILRDLPAGAGGNPGSKGPPPGGAGSVKCSLHFKRGLTPGSGWILEMRSFTTTHRALLSDARELAGVEPSSVDLVVTSPPYPMIEMWDAIFGKMSPAAAEALAREDGAQAFELMHTELDRVWQRIQEVLKPGGFACINIGDATRTLGGNFQLYSNHARILTSLMRIGLTPLPDILWRKPTNAPNKFMGSGMLPAGAYVTYEHEYILIARKGGKREIHTPEEKALRERSAYFWEERNVWFSDVWLDLRGTGQELVSKETRERSGAFPLELPHRLIHMYSLQGDTVLDPFAGTGTTLLAAMAAGRSSVGVELEPALLAGLGAAARTVPSLGAERVRSRLAAHAAFLRERTAAGKPPGNRNVPYGFAVVTRQESRLHLPIPIAVEVRGNGTIEIVHELDAASGRLEQAELPMLDRTV